MILRAYWRTCLLILFVLLVGTAQPSLAQASGDTVFNEIELTPEGVVAYDSAGYRWEYSFSEGAFVRGERVGPRDGRGETPRTEQREIQAVEERCTEELIVRPFRDNVQVGYEEYVDGDIVAYGRITIKGWVKGSVQSINDKVLVTESGQVDGDVKAPEIQVKRGGLVLGNQVITNRLDFPVGQIAEEYTPNGIWVVLSFFVYFLLCAFVVVSLMSRQGGNINETIRKYPMRSFGLGVIAVFMIPLLVLLLAITIVGVIAILFLPFIYLFAMSMGVIAWAQRAGNWFLTRIGRPSRSPLANAMIGVVMLMFPWLLVAIMMSSDGTAFGFGVFALVLMSIVTLIPLFAGLGAVILTRFGNRRYLSLHDRMGTPDEGAPAPAPPPIPPVPTSIIPTPPLRGGEPLPPPRPSNE